MKILSLLEQLQLANEPLVGCSIAEIDEVKAISKVKLPNEYIEFLSIAGKHAGKLMLGSSCFYPEILTLSAFANEILDENNLPPLPNDSFVFWMHQGYQFAYFGQSQLANPPIHYFSESENGHIFRSEESFTNFIVVQARLSGIELKSI